MVSKGLDGVSQRLQGWMNVPVALNASIRGTSSSAAENRQRAPGGVAIYTEPTDESSKITGVPLGQRFELAHTLAMDLADSHRLIWTHESATQPRLLNGWNPNLPIPILELGWVKEYVESDSRTDFSESLPLPRVEWWRPTGSTRTRDIYSLPVSR